MEETNFGNLNLEDGPRIPKFKFMKEEASFKKRILFLPKIFKDVAHLKEGYGYFHCLNGKKTETNPTGVCPACQAGQSAGIKTMTRYGMHLLVYATNSDGSLKKPFGYEVMAFVKNESQFKKVWSLHQQYQAELFNHDFVISCTNTDFQNFDYALDLNCVWKTLPNKEEILADINQKVAEFPLNKILAPEVTLETMNGIVSGQLPPRFETKNKPVQAAPASAPAASDMTFPPQGAAPYVPPKTQAAPVSAPAASVAASKSDLDILEELSR